MIDFSLVGLAPDDCRTLIDVGTNAGQFLFPAISFYQPRRIVAIEMLDDLAERLTADPRLSGHTVLRCAVGDRPRTAPVLRSVHSEASSLRELNAEAGAWYGIDLHQYPYGSVQVRTLDDICDELSIDTVDFLKIDVQGCEDAVLRGAARMLERTRRLMIEIEFVSVYQGQALAPAIQEQVEAAGFTYMCNVTEYRGQDGSLLHADALFQR